MSPFQKTATKKEELKEISKQLKYVTNSPGMKAEAPDSWESHLGFCHHPLMLLVHAVLKG